MAKSNPKVTSKYDRSQGAPRTPGRITKPGDTATTSGVQPKMGETNPPRLEPQSHTDRMPAGGVVRTVGFPGDGKAFIEASHTTGKHGADGFYESSRKYVAALDRTSYSGPQGKIK